MVASPFKCGPRIKRRDWRKLPIAKLTRAERAMRFIETYCRVPEGALVGQPIRLAIFQEDFFYAVLDNPSITRRAYLSIARKNAKTAIIACLLIVFLVGPEARQNSQICSGARSRDQAAQVFNYALKIIMFSPKLAELCRIVPSRKKIVGLPMNVEYAASSADAHTSMGGSPILAILDEVGQVKGPQDDFIDAITTSQGAHENPLLVAISTQAAEDNDLLSVWLDDAESSQDPHIVSHVYTAKPGCDVLDEKQWAAANPALGLFRNRKDLEEQAKQAHRMPSAENTFRNLCLNQRVSTTSPFISTDAWKSCAGVVLDFGSSPVFCGLDLSGRTDLTALIMVGRVMGVWQVRAHFWTPEKGLRERSKRDRAPYDLWHKQGYLHTTPGATVDYEYVAQDIGAILTDLNVRGIAYDRWRIDILRKEFENIGLDLPLVEYGQGFKDMSPALDAVESELLNGRIAHGGHPVLTMCAANAVVCKDPAGNRKLDKSKGTGRIDGMVALAQAMGIAIREEDQDIDAFISAPLSLSRTN
jgi:phage terminase large subunit-like protein